MKCKCGNFDRNEFDKCEYMTTEYWCSKCGATILENEDGEIVTNYEGAWRKLAKWIAEQDEWQKINPLIYWLSPIQKKMKEILNEQ